MSEIATPDEDGGIEPGSTVSFIVLAAKKGVQAAAVTLADPPNNNSNDNKENKENVPFETSFGALGVGDSGNASKEGDMGDGWGNGVGSEPWGESLSS
jgi:hypothetical protein